MMILEMMIVILEMKMTRISNEVFLISFTC